MRSIKRNICMMLACVMMLVSVLGVTPIEVHAAEVSTIDSAKLKENIATSYYGATDPWKVIEVAAYGKAGELTNKETFLEEAVAVVKDESSYATDLEKYIIAVSALGIDATKIPDGESTVDAIAALGKFDFDNLSSNAIIFAINAYDAGEYAVDKNAVQTKEELIELLLADQKTDGGWAFFGSTGDIDLTAMALHALAPYYLAKDASSAGITEQNYAAVKSAVERGITMLSEAQAADGTFISYGSANANSCAMVVTALSALGIDADTDERFVKASGSAYSGLLMFASSDLDGFLWVLTDNKANAMATEQAFRAIVSYDRFVEDGKAFNIYQFGKLTSDDTEAPVVTPTVKPEDTPSETPQETEHPTTTEQPVVTQKPTTTVKPVVTQKPTTTVKPVVTTKPTATVKPTVKPTTKPVTKPAKVTSLKSKKQTTTKVTLSWKKVSGAKGYQVYVYNTKKKKYECVKTINTNTASYTVSKVGGKSLAAGTTYKVKVRAYKVVNGKKVYGSYSNVLTTATKTKAPTLTVKAAKKKANLSWKKVSGANGYEVYMSTKKTSGYKKVTTIKKSSTVKYTKTKLKSNKKYYFKVRAYKTVNGKKVYSAYSTVKVVKVK